MRRPARCPDCGRFLRYNAYYARWECAFCDRLNVTPAREHDEPNLADIAILGGEPSL